MKPTVKQIKDYFNRVGFCRDVTIFHPEHGKMYVRMFGYAWVHDGIERKYNRAEFYCKELNAVLLGWLDRFSNAKVMILCVKQL